MAWLCICRYRYHWLDLWWRRRHQQLSCIGCREQKRSLAHIDFVGGNILAKLNSSSDRTTEVQVSLFVAASIGNIGEGAVLNAHHDRPTYHMFIPDVGETVVAEEAGNQGRDSIVLSLHWLLFIELDLRRYFARLHAIPDNAV